MNAARWQDLLQAVLRLGTAADIRCVIPRGDGRVSAAAGDIEELRETRAAADTAPGCHEAVG